VLDTALEAGYGMMSVWLRSYNRGRPHSSLGPGVPDPPGILAMVQKVKSRHQLGEGVAVLTKSVLGGLHHEYSMAPSVA
jgi:putative transposase